MSRLKSLIAATAVVVVLFMFCCGCGFAGEETGNAKLPVVTTLFPQYDFTRAIGQDKVRVTLLLPPGMEAHAYEPTPQDIVRIRKSRVFIYTGEYMEPWAHKIIVSAKGQNLVIVDVSKGITLMTEADHDEHEAHETHEEHQAEADHHHGGKDPHIWLDPIYAQKMVDNIVAGLSQADPRNRGFYQQNGAAYKAKLQVLHLKYTATLKKAKTRKIIYGGHFAFGYLAKRYGLEYISPYNGFAPDAEPTPQHIAQLVQTMKTSGIKVIYYEELIDPKVARVISGQTGAKMLLLHGAHNVKKAELQAGITYLKIMEQNLLKLKQGLGIR
jgi:zinc transport system substrate-binding protein